MPDAETHTRNPLGCCSMSIRTHHNLAEELLSRYELCSAIVFRPCPLTISLYPFIDRSLNITCFEENVAQPGEAMYGTASNFSAVVNLFFPSIIHFLPFSLSSPSLTKYIGYTTSSILTSERTVRLVMYVFCPR